MNGVGADMIRQWESDLLDFNGRLSPTHLPYGRHIGTLPVCKLHNN